MTCRAHAVAALLMAWLPTAAWATDSHPLTVSIDAPTGVSVDAVVSEMVFPATAPGMALDGLSATGSATVAYTASGEAALMVEIDVDPGIAGIDIFARADASECGTAQDVMLQPVPQPLIDLDSTGTCAERIRVQYEGTLTDPSAMKGTLHGTVTYTLL